MRGKVVVFLSYVLMVIMEIICAANIYFAWQKRSFLLVYVLILAFFLIKSIQKLIEKEWNKEKTKQQVIQGFPYDIHLVFSRLMFYGFEKGPKFPIMKPCQGCDQLKFCTYIFTGECPKGYKPEDCKGCDQNDSSCKGKPEDCILLQETLRKRKGDLGKKPE